MLATCNSIIDPANLQEVNSTIFTFQLSNKRIGWVEDILFVDIKTFHDYQNMHIFTQVRSKTENSGEEKSANALIFNKVGAKTTKNLGFLVQFLVLFRKSGCEERYVWHVTPSSHKCYNTGKQTWFLVQLY